MKSKADDEMRHLTVECLNYLDTRSEFWQQQKPLYARRSFKSQDAPRSAASGPTTSEDASIYVIQSMNEIDASKSHL